MLFVFDRVENIVRKGENDVYQHFIPFSTILSRAFPSGSFNPFLHILILTYQQQTAFENIVGKGEIACNKLFLLFPQCFLLNQIIASLFDHIFDIISVFAAEFEKPIIGISGEGLNRNCILLLLLPPLFICCYY